MIDEMQITSNVTFGIPSDFPSLVDSVVGSLKRGYRDYCFTNKQLKEIIEKCHEANVSFAYRKQLDEDCKIEYIELIPCTFYFAETVEENKVENIQVEMENLPVALIFCPKNNKTDITIDADYQEKNEKRVKSYKKLAYFDDDGYPVYIEDLTRMRKEKENGV